jgi:hypothetical protein
MGLVVLMGAFSVCAASAWAVVSPNNVLVQPVADVTYDGGTGLYTYRYSFTSDASSPLEVAVIMIPLNGSSVLNVVAPRGWTSGVWRDGSVLDFEATEIAPDWVDDGKLPPSPFQIKAGQTLSGFSFQSPDPPDFIDFHAQGFTQLPVLGVDVEEIEDRGVKLPSPLDPAESFKARTTGPHFSQQLFAGGRRPAVDGLLAFRNLKNRDIKPAPLQVDIEFAINGETVDQSTFTATLNNHDVTSDFHVTGERTRRAVFQASHPALNAAGRNVLLTVVSGLVPGTTRTANDVDRVTITVR